MEILKFSEPPKRSSRTKTQKRGGIMPLLAVAVSVAVIGGMSTTLAGTISLNSGGSVEFGQGVVTTAACDTTIRILPLSSFDSSSASVPFNVSEIELRDIGVRAGATSDDTATAGAGCLGKTFTLRAYDAAGGSLSMNAANATFISFKIPTETTTANLIGSYTVKSSDSTTFLSAQGFNAATGTNGDGLAGQVKVGGFKIPGSVTRITLESSDAAPSA